MKMSTVLLIGSVLCSTAALGATSAAKDSGFKNNITADLSVVTLNNTLSDVKHFKNIKLGYKITLKDDFSKVFYAQMDAIKYKGNHVGFGALIGAHQSHGMFRPFAEIDYQHSPIYDRLFNKEQFGYDCGVEAHYFPRLTSYAKYYDFADTDKRAIIVGTSFDVTQKIKVFANYRFKGNTSGTSAEFGVGYAFT